MTFRELARMNKAWDFKVDLFLVFPAQASSSYTPFLGALNMYGEREVDFFRGDVVMFK